MSPSRDDWGCDGVVTITERLVKMDIVETPRGRLYLYLCPHP